MLFLSLRLGRELYAVETLRVREVLQRVKITRVPRARPEVSGVINLRGSIVAVFDLRTLLGIEKSLPDTPTNIVVLEYPHEGETLVQGILVDSVQEVLEIDEDRLDPPPTLRARGSRHLHALARSAAGFILVLDVASLFGLEGSVAGSRTTTKAVVESDDHPDQDHPNILSRPPARPSRLPMPQAAPFASSVTTAETIGDVTQHPEEERQAVLDHVDDGTAAPIIEKRQIDEPKIASISENCVNDEPSGMPPLVTPPSVTNDAPEISSDAPAVVDEATGIGSVTTDPGVDDIPDTVEAATPLAGDTENPDEECIMEKNRLLPIEEGIALAQERTRLLEGGGLAAMAEILVPLPIPSEIETGFEVAAVPPEDAPLRSDFAIPCDDTSDLNQETAADEEQQTPIPEYEPIMSSNLAPPLAPASLAAFLPDDHPPRNGESPSQSREGDPMPPPTEEQEFLREEWVRDVVLNLAPDPRLEEELIHRSKNNSGNGGKDKNLKKAKTGKKIRGR
ncbi:MAG: chemotaxis protein CheW [Magnetococcales bacterium]|nr:chemotaxis protein CheW [Magnetococcales bacterium]